MPTLAQQASRICDDCDRKSPALEWWRMNIRICPSCRKKREDDASRQKDQPHEG